MSKDDPDPASPEGPDSKGSADPGGWANMLRLGLARTLPRAGLEDGSNAETRGLPQRDTTRYT